MGDIKNLKVIIIGLDGATWDLIKPWADAGELPTFRNLIENGSWGDLESTFPPITCPAWISMLTGKNPGRLGIYYFRQYDWNSMQMKNVKIEWQKYKPLWKILSSYGMTTNIINTPTATPDPADYKGVFVQCPIMGSEKSEEFAYPDFVRKKLKDIGYERIIPNPNMIGEREFLKKLYAMVENKVSLALDLFKNTDWDLFFFTIFYTDQIKHFFWHFMDPRHPQHKPSEYRNAILDFYKYIDDKLKVFLDLMKKDYVLFLVSDHGHGPMHTEVNYNFYFAEKGLLKFRHKYDTRLLLSLLKIFIKAVFSGQIKFEKIKRKFQERLSQNLEIVWQNTIAYNPTPNAIFINLKGREKFGVVDPKNYNEVREIIINNLKELRDPITGAAVVEKIWRKEEIYSGEFLNEMPDLIVEPVNESEYINYGFDGLKKGRLFSVPTPLTYSTHTRRGIFLAYGNGIKKNFKIEGAKIYDVLPTILHIMGVSLPKGIDGKVLNEIIDKRN